MDHWTELRTALTLARLGTVKAAAAALGVHRATVNRHVDTLEGTFGAPLFQRHARGYALTDAGRDMLEVASRADEMFADLEGRAHGQAGKVSGELVVTALAGVASLIMPAMRLFAETYPEIALTFAASAELARLEYGEAHVALRAGLKPQEPDYVVIPYRYIRFGLYAHRSYVERFGMPVGDQDFARHRFVGALDGSSRTPQGAWLKSFVPEAALALRSGHQEVVRSAVSAGLGIGFLPEIENRPHLNLVEISAPRDEWSVPIWIVTHVDLHRTFKVREFVRCLKEMSEQVAPL